MLCECVLMHRLQCCVCECVLMHRLQDKGVGKDAEWGSLLEKPPLRHADDSTSATLSHAVDIFVERHHLLWKVRRPVFHLLILLFVHPFIPSICFFSRLWKAYHSSLCSFYHLCIHSSLLKGLYSGVRYAQSRT